MADDVHQTMTQTTEQVGFWKPRHALIGLAVVMGVVLLVRACGGESGEDSQQPVAEAGAGDSAAPVTQAPPPAQQWPQYPPAQQQFTQPYPAYPYTVPAQPQARPPAQMPSSDTGNPWAVRGNASTPAYNLPNQAQPGGQNSGWGQPQQQRPAYTQPQGSAQYRPLAEQPAQPRQSQQAPVVQVPVPVTTWPAYPYDRPAGSSYGDNPPQSPYMGVYPGGVYPGAGYGYPGGGLYGVPGYGTRLPGYPGWGSPWY